MPCRITKESRPFSHALYRLPRVLHYFPVAHLSLCVRLRYREVTEWTKILPICLLQYEASLRIVWNWKELCSAVQFSQILSVVGVDGVEFNFWHRFLLLWDTSRVCNVAFLPEVSFCYIYSRSFLEMGRMRGNRSCYSIHIDVILRVCSQSNCLWWALEFPGHVPSVGGVPLKSSSQELDTNWVHYTYMHWGRDYVSCHTDPSSVAPEFMDKLLYLCKAWGFHGGDYAEWCLLECYAVWLL
jgi:hypothetical protein